MRISKTLEIIFVRIISNVSQRKNTFWLLPVVNEGWKSFPLLEIISSHWRKLSKLQERLNIAPKTKNVMWYVNDFHLEMTFLEIISIWKWFFWNDLLLQKMISGCFWGKKMIYRCEKSFPSSSEMIFYTRKWFRRNSKMIFVKWFLEHFAPVLKMWFTLGKKTISCGNGHFRKWMEIIFFQKMLDNLPIPFLSIFILLFCIS